MLSVCVAKSLCTIPGVFGIVPPSVCRIWMVLAPQPQKNIPMLSSAFENGNEKWRLRAVAGFQTHVLLLNCQDIRVNLAVLMFLNEVWVPTRRRVRGAIFGSCCVKTKGAWGCGGGWGVTRSAKQWISLGRSNRTMLGHESNAAALLEARGRRPKASRIAPDVLVT